MSHEITKIDRVFSTVGTEWHGLAKQVSEIETGTVEPILFPLRESVQCSFTLDDGSVFDGGESKGIFADLRGNGGDLVQLSTMGEGYTTIPNREVWEGMQRAFDGVGVKFKVTSAGTLGACRKFFISVSLEGHEEMTCGGEKFLSNLNFITSHDGTLAMQAYDSNIRIVCMNTLRWSMDAAGAVGFNVKHTKNSAAQMENLEQFLNELLKGRDVFKSAYDALSESACDVVQAENFAKGYLATVNKLKKGMELSTRSKNAAMELVNLHLAGTGNNGETLKDLANAGTEYWTHGNGTGKQARQGEKIVASSFGMAANHKNQWFDAITDKVKRDKLTSYGATLASVYA